MTGAAVIGFVCPECGQRSPVVGFCPSDGHRLAATDDPLLGDEVGRYRLARLLGEGGMGRVYLAVQPAIGSRVAVKILSDQCARNPELLERFFAEARAVNLIRHENIVSVIDLARLPDGRPFIVMEFIEGQTLASVVRAAPVPLGGLVQVMTEVLSALAAAHALGIVHRDLKPDNVLITAEGHAKVLDFGIAKLAPELQQQLSPRTRTGALLGTPQYMAPEQITGSGGVDPRTDLYAAGVVLYELVTGRPPFASDTLFDLMRAHLEEMPPPPRMLRPDLPAALEQVILIALAKQPDQRFPTAAAMAQALQHAAAELPADQWRSLSSRSSTSLPVRGGVTPVPSPIPGLPAPAQPQPVPHGMRQTRAAGAPAAPPATGRGRIGLVIGGIVVAALTVGVVLLVVMQPASAPQVVAASPPARAPGAPAVSATEQPAAPAAGATAPPATVAAAPPPVPAAPAGTGTTDAAAVAAAPPAAAAAVPSAGTGAIAGAATPRPARTATAGSSRNAAVGAAAAGSAAPGPAPAPAPAPAAPAASAPAPGRPTIAGGGSAADHGVHIGDNVAIGPNVVIGSATQPAADRETLERPADYNPRRFDPVGYLPRAQKLARELLPDAQLTSFEFDPVFSDGRVDLTMEGRDRSYEFRSRERSAFPAGRPRNLPIDRKCRVSVEVGARTVTARC